MFFEKMKTDFNQERLQALSILGESCLGKNTRFHTGNCAHCEIRKDIPNYSGWARVYVQAGEPIRKAQAQAFLQELSRVDNIPYVEALKEDIIHFGLTIN
jgi:hypothetical protein